MHEKGRGKQRPPCRRAYDSVRPHLHSLKLLHFMQGQVQQFKVDNIGRVVLMRQQLLKRADGTVLDGGSLRLVAVIIVTRKAQLVRVVHSQRIGQGDADLLVLPCKRTESQMKDADCGRPDGLRAGRGFHCRCGVQMDLPNKTDDALLPYLIVRCISQQLECTRWWRLRIFKPLEVNLSKHFTSTNHSDRSFTC